MTHSFAKAASTRTSSGCRRMRIVEQAAPREFRRCQQRPSEAGLVFDRTSAKTGHCDEALRATARVRGRRHARRLRRGRSAGKVRCDCAGISLDRALRQSTAVFRGTVLEKHSVGRRAEARTDIRFQVDAVYKGAVHQEQVVASPKEATACGLDPKVGSTWVIFAVDGIEGAATRRYSASTTLCSGNVPSGTAPAILGEARPRSTAPPTGKVDQRRPCRDPRSGDRRRGAARRGLGGHWSRGALATRPSALTTATAGKTSPTLQRTFGNRHLSLAHGVHQLSVIGLGLIRVGTREARQRLIQLVRNSGIAAIMDAPLVLA